MSVNDEEMDAEKRHEDNLYFKEKEVANEAEIAEQSKNILNQMKEQMKRGRSKKEK